MNPNIAMSGMQPNFLATKQFANEAAQKQIQNNQANALAGYVQQNGAGIMNGDPNALAGYAAYDPAGALGIQNTRQSMAYDAEEMQMKRTAIAQQTAETLAANKTAADIAAMEAEQDKLQGVLTGAFQFYQSGDEAGYNAFLQQNQLDPSQYAFSNFPAIAAQADGVIDGIKAWKDSFGAPDAPEWRAATPEEAAQFGAQGGQISTKTGKFDPNPKESAGLSIRTLPDGTTEVTQGGMGGGGSDKQVFDTMAESAKMAESARTGLTALAEATKALDSGIVSGFGADQQLATRKALAIFGIGDPGIINNTETFRSAIAPQVAAMLKATVGSANISNADREFAEKAAGGAITLDSASIERLVGIMEKGNRAVLDRHSEKLNKVYPEGKGFDRERALFGLDAPSAGLDPKVQSLIDAAGITPDDWNSLTPDEQAEFLQ